METSLGLRSKSVIVSGGILKSAASLKILADALGRDLQMSMEPEASLRGAAVHALAQNRISPPRLRSGRKVRHNRKFAALHFKRRERQITLERLIVGKCD